jgi:cell division protein ZapA
MSDMHNTVSLNILGKLYKVKCPQDKIAELREAGQYLEAKMRETGQGGKTASADRLAVITALNITYELLTQKRQANTYIDMMNQQIRALQIKIESALAGSKEKGL